MVLEDSRGSYAGPSKLGPLLAYPFHVAHLPLHSFVASPHRIGPAPNKNKEKRINKTSWPGAMRSKRFITEALNKFQSPLRGSLRGKKSKGSSTAGQAFIIDFCDADSMGKSNKFDYTNRPNSGPKLGQIIGAALQKEVEKAKKEAETSLHKARKQSGDSAGLTVEFSSNKHIIDLKAPNKELTDDGVCALADGLEIALKSGDSNASLALEDFNLSGNGITTKSLARLAPIIEAARYDLKTINLSNNKICVENDEQAQHWETFLQAFKCSLKLRRLDLSGNVQLGSRAMEIFARVHSMEPPIEPVPSAGETSVLSLVEEGDEHFAQSAESFDVFGESSGNRRHQMTAGRLIKRRQGLRSIPYITFNNTGMDDAGALWLSHIMVDHHYPNQLMDEVNATNADSAIKTYQQDTDSHGIDSADNANLGKEGRLLLEKTESLRRQKLLEDNATVASTAPSEEAEAPRRSIDRRHSRAATGDRRVSIRSIRTDDGGEHEATEMESLQRKIQRHIIEQGHLHGVELWHTALSVLRTSRMLLFIAPIYRRYYIGPAKFKMPKLEMPDAVTVQPPSPTDTPNAGSPRALSIDATKGSKAAPLERPSYGAKVSGAAGQDSTDLPESPLSEVTNFPVTPLLKQKRTHRQGAFSEGTDLDGVTNKLNDLIANAGSPDSFILYQQQRIVQTDYSFRNTAMPCQLPFHLLRRIAMYAVGGKETNVLSPRQLHTAINRGQNRETLSAEREWLKRDESAQLWMMLDSLRCLAYGME